MHKSGLLLAGAVVVAVSWPGVAAAESGLVLVDDDKSFVRTAGTGGDETVDLTLSNPTTAPVPVVPALAQGESTTVCKPVSADPASVPAQQQVTVKITFGNCPADHEPNIRFVLTDGTSNVLGKDVKLLATPPKTPKPTWSVLLWFIYAAMASGVLAGFSYLSWPFVSTYAQRWVAGRKDDAKAKEKAAKANSGEEISKRSLGTRISNARGRGTMTTPLQEKVKRQRRPGATEGLPGLSSSWSFKDSWASNATVVAALFTGLFSVTDVATSILGDSAKSVLTVVAVAVAIGVGLAAIAPMALQSCRTISQSLTTPLGIFFASTITLAATGGEIWVTVLTVDKMKKLDHGWLITAGVLTSLLLVVYAVMSTWQNLSAGMTEEPKTPKPKVTLPIADVRALIRDIVHELPTGGGPIELNELHMKEGLEREELEDLVGAQRAGRGQGRVVIVHAAPAAAPPTEQTAARSPRQSAIL